MQRYPVRTSHRRNLTIPNLESLARSHFEAVESDSTEVRAQFGAIARLAVRPDRRELAVEVTMDPKVSSEVARETISRYNRFLQAATGYSSKERAKRLKKSAGSPDESE